MKLLDLQTGKYLELGKDWVYIEEYIGILDSNVLCGVKVTDVFSKTLHTNPIINQIAEKVGAVMYGGRYVLIECLGIVGNGDIIRNMKNTGMLFQEKVGESILNINDYFISNNQIYSKTTMRQQEFYKSDFPNILHKIRTDFEYALDFFNKRIDFKYAKKGKKKEIESKIKGYMQSEPDKKLEIYYFQHKLHSGLFIIANIFEEFAKKEQGIENKFDELYNVIYGNN